MTGGMKGSMEPLQLGVRGSSVVVHLDLVVIVEAQLDQPGAPGGRRPVAGEQRSGSRWVKVTTVLTTQH